MSNIASLLSRSYSSEKQAKKTLEKYILSLEDSRDIVSLWIARLKRNLHRWLPKIFCCISFSFLPTTNNDLEAFNLKIKKLYRRITGHKNSHLFLFSSGVAASYALCSDLDLSPDSYADFPHSEIILQKKMLFNLDRRSLIYSAKKDLQNFLFEIERLA